MFGFDNYDIPKDNGTGSSKRNESFKIISYPFGKYEIKIKLTTDNEFVEIVEIKINKDFRKKVMPKGYHDVDEFYRE